MAEGDDDETFGEFTLASFQSNPQSNGSKSVADDEWGDFVKSPQQQSKPSDPALKGNNPTDDSISPPRWVKPSGALPLSIFGGAEEEEEGEQSSAVSGDFNRGKKDAVAGNFYPTSVGNKIPNPQNLSIADLYNQYSQIKPENGPGSISAGRVDSVENEAHSRSAVTGLRKMDLNDAAVGVSDHSQLASFKSYVPDPSRSADPFGSWSTEFAAFSSILNTTPNVQITRSDLDMNGQKQELVDRATAIDDDDGDDGWEFTDAFSERLTEEANNNVVSMAHGVSGKSAYSSGTGSSYGTSNGSVDFFTMSTGSFGLVENGAHFTSAVTELRNMDLNDAVGVSDHSQLANKSENDEFSFKSYVQDPSRNADLFGIWSPEFTGFSSILNSTTPNVQTTSPDLGMNGKKEELVDPATAIDDDDGGWEFKDAFSEHQTEEVNNNVGSMGHEVSGASAHSSGAGSGSNKSMDLFATSNGSIDFFARSTGSVGYFPTSSDESRIFQEVDLIKSSMATLNGFTSHTNSITEQNNIKGLLNDSTNIESEEFDEDFGEFTAAFSETVPKPGEASSNDVLSPSKDLASTTTGKIQEKDTKLNYHNGAIPLSIFGNEEPESGGSSDVQDVLMQQSTFDQRKSHTPATAIAINDLISSLYSQTEQTSATTTINQPTKTQLGLCNAISSSDLVNDDDHLDASSWDFKDASLTTDDREASLYSIGDTYLSHSSKLKLNNHLDFYSKLKEELCFVTKNHIESLKQAQDNAALSGEDARAASLDEEFKFVCKELEQMNFLLDESNSRDRPSGDHHLNEFVEVLLELQFQKLESEYHISQKLLLVENDLGSAMELVRHTTTMLKILTIGTSEDRRAYTSIWFEMVSVCAQELKHGAFIWNQAMKKHAQSQLLSEPQGKEFVLALGEIYRVIVVLGASAKLFKPWTLSGSIDSADLYILLEECHTLWSTSGLEEALTSVSAPTASDGTSLLKSIKHILGLDALTLQNYVFKEKESWCRLSILTAGVVPGLKMIMWDDEQCFVTLANLWANLISRDPPKLPQLNLG